MRIILFAFLIIAVRAGVDPKCPPPSGNVTTCVITEDSCYPGRPCPEGLVCCPEGCGSICKPPVFPKDTCVSDSQCPEGYNCCSVGFTKRCKLLGCPGINIDPLLPPLCRTPVIPPCKVDGDCSKGEICCPGICYNRCMRLLLPQVNKPGICSTLPDGIRIQCVQFKDDCIDDSGCPGDQKCCNVACGKSCVSSIKPIICPPVCAIFCPNGNVLDENGCPTCQCKECNPVRCKLYCPFGFKIDRTGCEYCSCKDTPCAYGALPASDTSGKYINCGRGGTSCPNGTECNIESTDRYAVCCPVCGAICRMYCIYGFKLINGCPICQCKETPCRNGLLPLKNVLGNTITCDRDGSAASCPADSICRASDDARRYAVCCPYCSPIACALYCPYGYKVDNNGCEICSCNECSQIMCALYCKNGFKRDKNGCEICECEECSQIMCALYCENGFKRDKNGCEICECEDSSILPRNFGCPTPPSRNLVKCSLNNDKCNSDSDCPSGNLCCNNPCGRYCTQSVPVKDGFCPAQPDPSLVDCASFSDNCYKDSDCPDFRKCCPTACGNVCQAPMPTPAENPGVCKYVPALPECSSYQNERKCEADYECPFYEKCCSTNCGKFCLESEPLVVNPGECAIPKIDVLCVFYNKQCNQDGNCPPNQKCCEDKCGTSCQEPRPKQGVCPVPRDPAVVLCLVDSKDECIRDVDCPGDDKCCDDPCGKRCDLVRQKPGICPVPPDASLVSCVDAKDKCTNDRECPIDLKCCDHPCGRRCDLVRPKPGMCPVKPDPSEVLCDDDSRDECTNDRECPIDLKCCDHPCGKRCDLVEPGKCPIDILLPCPLKNECLSDLDCAVHEVCCAAVGCPRGCVDPALTEIKPGICPAPQDRAGACAVEYDDECKTDLDCSGDEKCCDDPCGKRCDLIRPKPGSCPAFSLTYNAKCHHNKCTHDYECKHNLKCCSTTCGFICRPPISGSTTDEDLSESTADSSALEYSEEFKPEYSHSAEFEPEYSHSQELESEYSHSQEFEPQYSRSSESDVSESSDSD